MFNTELIFHMAVIKTILHIYINLKHKTKHVKVTME